MPGAYCYHATMRTSPQSKYTVEREKLSKYILNTTEARVESGRSQEPGKMNGFGENMGVMTDATMRDGGRKEVRGFGTRRRALVYTGCGATIRRTKKKTRLLRLAARCYQKYTKLLGNCDNNGVQWE